jgi:tetratricopeptide (TPR) repeat protein
MRTTSLDREYTLHPELMAGRLAELFVDHRSAFAHYRTEIRTSGYYKAHLALGALLKEKGRLREACDTLLHAVTGARLARDRLFVNYALDELGCVYERMGRRRDAEQAWRRALRYAPRSGRLRALLGVSRLEAGDRRRGAPYIRDAVRLMSRDVTAQRLVGYALVRWGLDLRTGVRLLQRVRQTIDSSDPRLPLLLVDISDGLLSLGRRRAAERLAEEAVRLAPARRIITRQLLKVRASADGRDAAGRDASSSR